MYPKEKDSRNNNKRLAISLSRKGTGRVTMKSL
jgi:hypothetical protein